MHTSFQLSRPIENAADVRHFFDFLLEVEALNFHPDTPFADYINAKTGAAT